MVIDISDSNSSRFEDLVGDASTTTWTLEYKVPNLLLGQPGEPSTSAITAICVKEEVLDWGDDGDDGMDNVFIPPPNQSFCRMPF